MRNLPVPTTKNKNKLKKIIESKNKPFRSRLNKVNSNVRIRYDEYDVFSSQLENLSLSTISGVFAEALIKCYTSKTNEMSILRDELLYPELDDFDECPLCGIGEPTTLDHYLPKESFPEFSVLAKNLIPVCGVCNGNYKGKKWVENGNRLFFHAYYDIFPDDYFFGVNVVVNNSIKIDFFPKVVANEPYFSNLFSQHFENLALNKRYKIKAASEISRKKRSFERIFVGGGGADDVASSLLNEAGELEMEYSKNYWKAVLYRALSGSMEFCEGGFRKKTVK